MIDRDKKNWADWIAIAQFSYNDKIHTSTGYSPFFMNYGLHPYKGQYMKPSERSPEADKFVTQMKEIWDQATKSLEKTNEKMKKTIEKKGVVQKKFEIGQKVWVSTTNFPSRKKSAAFAPKFKGPFEVVQQVGPAAYKIKLPLSWKIHDVFHESHLKEYRQPEFPKQKEQEKKMFRGTTKKRRGRRIRSRRNIRQSTKEKGS